MVPNHCAKFQKKSLEPFWRCVTHRHTNPRKTVEWLLVFSMVPTLGGRYVHADLTHKPSPTPYPQIPFKMLLNWKLSKLKKNMIFFEKDDQKTSKTTKTTKTTISDLNPTGRIWSDSVVPLCWGGPLYQGFTENGHDCGILDEEQNLCFGFLKFWMDCAISAIIAQYCPIFAYVSWNFLKNHANFHISAMNKDFRIL